MTRINGTFRMTLITDDFGNIVRLNFAQLLALLHHVSDDE
jgi:hypothetical protein